MENLYCDNCNKSVITLFLKEYLGNNGIDGNQYGYCRKCYKKLVSGGGTTGYEIALKPCLPYEKGYGKTKLPVSDRYIKKQVCIVSKCYWCEKSKQVVYGKVPRTKCCYRHDQPKGVCIKCFGECGV